MFLSRTSYTEKVKELLKEGDNLCIAVAFWGREAENLLGKQTSARIICNLESGGTNPHAIKALMDKGNKNLIFRSNDRLHAKVILSDKGVIIGSANLSANGLGHEDNELGGWEEAGLYTTDTEIITNAKNWFQDQWTEANEVTEEMLDDAQEKHQIHRNTRPTNSVDLFSCLMGKNAIAEFKDKNLHVVLHSEAASESAHIDFEEYREEKGLAPCKTLSWYEGFGVGDGDQSLPDDSYLLDFFFKISDKGNVTLAAKDYGGLWYRENGDLDLGKTKKRERLLVVRRKEIYLGLKHQKKTLAEFLKKYKPTFVDIIRELQDKEQSCIRIPIYDVLTRHLERQFSD